MADNRKYYYLKLKENFFDSDSIVLLEDMKDGILYSNILLKMYLKSLKNGGKLQLDEHMKHEQIVFSVENAGVHIPENSIPRLFDAFYRVEQSRSRKTGGSGLGLYIVQEILHQYGSECTVCNTQAGVKFSFII